MDPIVSVLVTCYNREQYITTAIESVLAQSFQDWELIIVDDQSTDRSLAIAQEYAQRDVRIRLYRNDKNLGDYPNRNQAASYARGKYLKYVDSDDAIYPHCLAVMVHMMERHPDAALLLCAWSPNDAYYPFVLSPEEAYRRHFVHGERMTNSPLTCMYRRDRFEQVGRFDTSPPGLSCDYDMVLRLARDWPVVVAPTGLCFYRVHGGQVSHSRGDALHHRTPVSVLLRLRHLRHPSCPLTPRERRWAIGQSLRLGLRYAAGLALKKFRLLEGFRLLRLLAPRPTELMVVAVALRPQVLRPQVLAEPDWDDFPDAMSAGLAQALNGLPSCSVLVCGEGGLSAWCRTLASLHAQWHRPLITALLTPEQAVYCDSLREQFPEVEVRVTPDRDRWAVRNEWARLAQGDLVKFADPGVIFYPYALYLEVQGLQKYPKAQCLAAGSFGPTLYPTLLSAEEAKALDHQEGMCAFRMPLSCVAFRRSVFARQAFRSDLDDQAPYALVRACVAEGGLVTAHEGLCSAHFRCAELTVPRGA